MFPIISVSFNPCQQANNSFLFVYMYIWLNLLLCLWLEITSANNAFNLCSEDEAEMQFCVACAPVKIAALFGGVTVVRAGSWQLVAWF